MGRSRSPRRNSSRLFLRRQLNEVVTLEEAIDARAIGERIDTLAAELMQDEAAVPNRDADT